MIPFQGGTNEQVVHRMYNVLRAEGKHKNLRVYWYTAKDQSRPIGATLKKRNCHGDCRLISTCTVFIDYCAVVKFMCIDDQVTIVGNGNQGRSTMFTLHYIMLTG